MARATFRLLNKKGERVGSFSFDGRSRKSAQASGAGYLRRLGIGSAKNPKAKTSFGYKSLPRMIAGEAYKMIRKKGVRVTPEIKRKVQEGMRRGLSASQIAFPFRKANRRRRR